MGDNTPRSIGLPMLIVVFTSICLFSFSGIAYSMARASYQRSQNAMNRTSYYYEACNEAENFLHELESIPEKETTYEFTFGPAMDEIQVTIVPDGSSEGFHIKSWVLADTASWEAPEAAAEGAQGQPEGPQAPAEGPQAPAEGPQAPAEGPQAPAEGPQAPAEGPQAPAEGPQAPAE